MRSDNEIYGAFNPLWQDIKDDESFPARRPLLAHYTSIATLENIMANDELWFSNPLYMNDMEELRFGIQEGARAFRQHEKIRMACGSASRHELLLGAFEYYFDQFINQHAFDTYVFCMSEHEADNSDGLLSMWRGYGGNGSGAAIIFDTANLVANDNSPFIFSEVMYATHDERRRWINDKLEQFSDLLVSEDVPDDKLSLPVYSLFERIKIFAIFTKHRGFSEEREWRAVYMRERDQNQQIDGMLHYAIGRNGVEPKLKYKVVPIEGLTQDDLSLEKIVSQIILGPSVSSPLAVSAVRRMLEKVGKDKLANRLVASTTPFRPV